MQPRTLEQIMGELGSSYDPQINNIRQRQEAIPAQMQAEEQGLQAKQTSAYDQILGGARQRGLGFSGIPLGEQAKYSATEYMPALARLRQSGREQAMTLEDSILGLQTQRRQQAQGIFDNDRNFYEQQRQFNEQQQFAKAQAAAQQRAASAASAGARPTLGSLGGVMGASTGGGGGNETQQAAYNDVYTRVSQQSPGELQSDYVATAMSAKNGNPVDLAKLQLYRQLRPDLFKFKYAWEK